MGAIYFPLLASTLLAKISPTLTDLWFPVGGYKVAEVVETAGYVRTRSRSAIAFCGVTWTSGCFIFIAEYEVYRILKHLSGAAPLYKS